MIIAISAIITWLRYRIFDYLKAILKDFLLRFLWCFFMNNFVLRGLCCVRKNVVVTHLSWSLINSHAWIPRKAIGYLSEKWYIYISFPIQFKYRKGISIFHVVWCPIYICECFYSVRGEVQRFGEIGRRKKKKSGHFICIQTASKLYCRSPAFSCIQGAVYIFLLLSRETIRYCTRYIKGDEDDVQG